MQLLKRCESHTKAEPRGEERLEERARGAGAGSLGECTPLPESLSFLP